MSKPELAVSISSGSCIDTNFKRPDNILWPPHATQATATRIIHAAQELALIFDLPISASLMMARVHHLPELQSQLKQHQLPIDSYDIPLVETDLGLLDKLGHNLLKLDLKTSFNDVGWSALNVPSKQALASKLQHVVPSINPIIFRVNYQNWIGSHGAFLRQQLRPHQQNIIYAIEPHDQLKPSEYIEKVIWWKLQGYPVGFDFDTGHIAKSQQYTNPQETPNPLSVYDTILSHSVLSQLLVLTSLNPFNPDETQTHQDFFSSAINYSQFTSLLGKRARQSTLAFIPTILLEFHPREYKSVLGNKTEFSKIKSAFDSE